MTKSGICACHSEEVHEAVVKSLRDSMPAEEEILHAAELFKAFADATRLRILTTLMKGEICVCDIADVLGMTQSAISHQLRLLKNAHLIRARREGKTVFYALADSHVMAILACATEHIRE
ncbi:MAG: winged helix-turn-helix transcriptional regulator [Clostridia bacterium]|nr:winged helix-turn-helix transcriptional regulator [Clostridia bacterium]